MFGKVSTDGGGITPSPSQVLFTIDDKGLQPVDGIYSGTISPPNPGYICSFNIQWYRSATDLGGNGRVANINKDSGLYLNEDGSRWFVDVNNLANWAERPTPDKFQTAGMYALSIYAWNFEGQGQRKYFVEPDWDIKYLVNGNWIYEVTGENVEQNESRNTAYRLLATEIVFNTNVKTIGYLAFRYWNFQKVTFNDGLTDIGYYAFEMCKSLLEVLIPDSVQTIGGQAFGGCEAVKKLVIGAGVVNIGDGSLINLYNLKTLVFKCPPPVFGSNVFGNGGSGGTNPEAIYVPDVNAYKEAHQYFYFKDAIYPLTSYNP